MRNFSVLDIVAGLLVAAFLVGPPSAGMIASHHASESTKAKSMALVNSAEEQRK